MTTTKFTIVEAVKSAIKAIKPERVQFEHFSTLLDEEFNMATRTFRVNGIGFRTGWRDAEEYSFLEKNGPLDVLDLKLLLWWLEQEETVVNY